MKGKWTVSVLLMIAAALLLSGCGQEAAVAPQLLEPAGVQKDTVQVYRGEIYRLDVFDASVKAYAQALCFEEGGTVARVYAYPGAFVQAGDVLVELDRSKIDERIRELKAESDYIRQDYAYADALLELDVELLETELRQLQAQRADEMQLSLKKNEIAQKKALLRQNRALREPELTAMQSELDKLTAQAENRVLRAPFSGRIVFCREMAGGSQIGAYQTLVCIADESRLFIESVNISEGLLHAADFLYVQSGGVSCPITPVPINQEEYITAVLAGNTPGTCFELSDAALAERLETGAYAAVYVVRDYVSDTLLLPQGTVMGEGDGRYVYVEENGERVRRAVKTGVITDSLVQIVQGVEEGEVVYVQN